MKYSSLDNSIKSKPKKTNLFYFLLSVFIFSFILIIISYSLKLISKKTISQLKIKSKSIKFISRTNKKLRFLKE